MINNNILVGLGPILSNKEIEVVLKRLNNKHITQTESNYLSRSIRPKLKSAEFASSNQILSLLNYKRKKYEREDNILKNKIIRASEKIIKDTKSIILFGSYVRNNHSNYRDIDVLIVLNKKTWKTSAEKNKLEKNIEKSLEIKADISLITNSDLNSLLPYSPLLQNELEHHKIIYGSIRKDNKRIIDKTHLYKKLLEVEYVIELKKEIKAKYIYNSIRSCLAIGLFLKKEVNNKRVIETIEGNIGKITAESLINCKENPTQREIALKYLEYLYSELKRELK